MNEEAKEKEDEQLDNGRAWKIRKTSRASTLKSTRIMRFEKLDSIELIHHRKHLERQNEGHFILFLRKRIECILTLITYKASKQGKRIDCTFYSGDNFSTSSV
jgi:hypothetical protein